MKPRGYVEVDNIEEELPYQDIEMPNVVPVTIIEKSQGLADSTIVQLVTYDAIEPIEVKDEHDSN